MVGSGTVLFYRRRLHSRTKKENYSIYLKRKRQFRMKPNLNLYLETNPEGETIRLYEHVDGFFVLEGKYPTGIIDTFVRGPKEVSELENLAQSFQRGVRLDKIFIDLPPYSAHHHT